MAVDVVISPAAHVTFGDQAISSTPISPTKIKHERNY